MQTICPSLQTGNHSSTETTVVIAWNIYIFCSDASSSLHLQLPLLAFLFGKQYNRTLAVHSAASAST